MYPRNCELQFDVVFCHAFDQVELDSRLTRPQDVSDAVDTVSRILGLMGSD